MGTPHFAEVILKKLIVAKYDIAAVFTQPDKKIGRKQEMKKSLVKKLAEKNAISVFEPENLSGGNAVDEITRLRPDLVAVAAYGKILPKSILEIPRYGSMNVHASLLPKFRGAAPVQGAILAGEKETGITLMVMREKLDTGEIIAQKKVKISEEDNAETLTNKLAEAGAKLLVEVIPKWASGSMQAVPQDEKRTSYCRAVEKEDGKIDWNESAEKISRRWRAYQPWPGIYSFWDKKRLKLAEIKTKNDFSSGEKPGKVVKYNREIAVQAGKGIVILKKVQAEGKKEMGAEEFVRGNSDFLRARLT